MHRGHRQQIKKLVVAVKVVVVASVCIRRSPVRTIQTDCGLREDPTTVHLYVDLSGTNTFMCVKHSRIIF